MPPPAQTKIRGYEGQLFYAPDGAQQTEWTNITDIDIDLKADSIDASDHATVGWKDKLSGLKEWTGTFKAMAIQLGTDLQAVFDAFTTGKNVAIAFQPQAISGGLVYTGTGVITSYKHGAPNSGVQSLDVTIEGRGPLVLGTIQQSGS